MRLVFLNLAVIFAGCHGLTYAETVLYSRLDSLDGWAVRSVGDATAAVVSGREGAPCAELRSAGGTVFLTRELPASALAGRKVTVDCQMKPADVVRGPQASSTAKLHLAVETPAGIQHFSARLTGTANWQPQGLTADVPRDARRAVLNLGLEACAGRVSFSELIVRNDQRGVHPLNLAPAANANHEQIGLGAFPNGAFEWKGIPFRILDGAANDGGDCFRLRGAGHDDWPDATAAPIPVGRSATTIYILHAALGGRDKGESPCAIWTARLSDGHSNNLSIFEGREIGAVGSTKDLENWQVTWRGSDAAGTPVTFGVTKWMIYEDTPIVSLSCRAYAGAPPVVLAVTVVEGPRPKTRGVFDEEEGGGE
ncbi:MAG: hypothetical protein HZA91_20560 [Verrucomicrobia bacterium]|nr:hypothetical protein [Verrucomicrobiota bacterium]